MVLLGSPEILFLRLTTRYGFLSPCCTLARNAILWVCALNSGIYLTQLPVFWKDYSPCRSYLRQAWLQLFLIFSTRKNKWQKARPDLLFPLCSWTKSDLNREHFSRTFCLVHSFMLVQSRRKVLRTVMGQIWCSACTCRIRGNLL